MNVTPEEIQVISRMVDDLCGVVLDSSKGYLIESRLSEVAADAGCATFTELYYKARYKTDKALTNSIVDAITTNETLFFRDTSPFEALENRVIPDLIDARANTAFPKRLRIWSAACSTGQEPYSIAMTLRRLLPDVDSWNISITATDISDTAVQQAIAGRYSDHEIQRGMELDLLNKFFTREGREWKVKDELRGMITFRKINLLEPFVGMGPFDVVLCRNVAIYFSPDARHDLFQRIVGLLADDGVLFVGSAESLSDIGFVPLHHCRSVYYQPRKAKAGALA